MPSRVWAMLCFPLLLLAGPPYRATTLPPFDPDHEPKPAPNGFSAYSATSLSTIRHRWNFNAIRIPLIEPAPERAAAYRARLAAFEKLARTMGLTPVIAGSPEDHFETVDDTLPCPQPDPAELAARVRARLAELDARQASWTVAEFAPGRLITDLVAQDATTLDNGWVCGADDRPPALPPGIGLVVQAHLWKAVVRGLFPVSAAGSYELPRGGVCILYGPVFAARNADTPAGAAESAGVWVEIADSRGRRHRARLLYVSMGWGQTNFVLPDAVAAGPAQFTVHHADGASSTATALIVDSAPAIWTALLNARGPAAAFLNGLPLWNCAGGICRTIPVPVSQRTVIRVRTSGLRHAARLTATLCGKPLRVLGVSPDPSPGVEQVLLELTPAAISGEADLILFDGAKPSNVARLRTIAAASARARAELGRYLFYDARLSVDGKTSCASCHRQDLAFTDGRAVAQGATGQLHARSSMTLVNVGRRATLTWANPALHSLEAQVMTPLMGTAPVEMGATEAAARALIARDPHYAVLFRAAFPNQANAATLANLARAIAAFERTITSDQSDYERYRFGGDQAALSESAQRGEVLFYTEPRAGCFRCHSGRDFTDGLAHNTGVAAAPAKFLTPTLRNVALTAPYMHDGSMATLEDVIAHYASGGRHPQPAIDERMRAMPLSTQNREDLIAFLHTLTGPELLTRADLGDPW